MAPLWKRARSQKRELLSAIEDHPHAAPGSGPGSLFVTGCARSGTSAMVRLLNADPRIAVGMERFKYLGPDIHPIHFRPGYFLNPTPDETNILRPGFYRRLETKFEEGAVAFVGDKMMAAPRDDRLIVLGERFPACSVIFLLRDLADVVASYERRAADPDDVNWPSRKDSASAVRDWTWSIRNLRALVERDTGARVLIVPYEEFYAGERVWLERIYEQLALEVPAEAERAYEQATRGWGGRAARRRSRPAVRETPVARRGEELEEWARRLIESERPDCSRRAAGSARVDRDARVS